MSNNLVSKDNLKTILEGIGSDIVSKINTKDITEKQKKLIDKCNLLDHDTDDNSFLSDDGNYNKIDIEDTENKIHDIYELFNIEENSIEKWYNTKDLPTPQFYFTTQSYNNKIYCLGGRGSLVEIFNTDTNTWTTGQSMPTTRTKLSSEIYNNKIYVMGGWYLNNKSVVEIYDIEKDTWDRGTYKPTSFISTGKSTAIYNRKIYCVDNNIEVYDIETDTWSFKSYINMNRNGFTTEVSNGKIYCIGGYNNRKGYLDYVDIYDIQTNTWSIGKSMPTARYELSSEVYNNKIYCIGGNNYNDLNITEIYDVDYDTWSVGKPMITSRSRLSCCICNNRLYSMGGTSTGILTTNEYLTLPYMKYDIKTLPSNVKNKLDILNKKGIGNKVLCDKGEYIDIPKGYKFMDNNEIDEFLSELRF